MHVHPILIKGDAGSYDAAVEKLLGCMDRVGIQKANIVPMIADDGELLAYLNEKSVVYCAEFLKKSVEKHGDRFFSMLWVNPYLDIGFLKDTIREYVINGNIDGIKLLSDMSASDKRLEPLAAFLEEHDIPLLHHSWYITGIGERSLYSGSEPSEIACLARKFPGLRIAIAHMRGCGFKGIQDVSKLPNVWIDTSGTYYEDGYLEYALKAVGPDRILFGSDYPGRDMATQLSRIYSLELKQDDRDKLLGGNAEMFLGRKKV